MLEMPSPIHFQGNFSLKKSSSSAMGRNFSAHSCVLSVKGGTDGRDGSGKLCLEEVSSLPWYVNMVTRTGADPYH